MNDAILHRFYNKMLYFNAGVQLCIHNFEYYKNLIDTIKCITFIEKNITADSYILLCDLIGCTEDFIYKYIKKVYMHKSDAFIYEDDLCGGKKLCGVYISSENITAFSSVYGCDMTDFYYNTDRRKEKDSHYRQLAEQFFSSSGDYC